MLFDDYSSSAAIVLQLYGVGPIDGITDLSIS